MVKNRLEDTGKEESLFTAGGKEHLYGHPREVPAYTKTHILHVEAILLLGIHPREILYICLRGHTQNVLLLYLQIQQKLLTLLMSTTCNNMLNVCR